MEEQKELRTLDLFAGIGGIRIGFENAGFRTVFANDFDPFCKKTYDLNSRDVKLTVGDIKKIKSEDLPDFEVLLAGFPCQPFSIAGLRRGFSDTDRGNMFFEIERIIRDKKPKAFLLENVKNLKTHDSGNTYSVIKRRLKGLGYHVCDKVLNSAEYGNVPQNRERIYIVGFKNSNSCNLFKFPQKIARTVKVSDILDDSAPKEYYYEGKPLYEKLKNEITETNTFYQWRRKYVRRNKSGVCPTLTANMGMGGHNVPIVRGNKGIRKITPKECSRLQGFPEWYKIPEDLADSRLYKQFGNSVTVTVIERIAQEMKISMLTEDSYVFRESRTKTERLLPATS